VRGGGRESSRRRIRVSEGKKRRGWRGGGSGGVREKGGSHRGILEASCIRCEGQGKGSYEKPPIFAEPQSSHRTEIKKVERSPFKGACEALGGGKEECKRNTD